MQSAVPASAGAGRVTLWVCALPVEVAPFLSLAEVREEGQVAGLPCWQGGYRGVRVRAALCGAGGQVFEEGLASLLDQAPDVGTSKVIVGEMPSAPPEQIREAIDFLRQQAGSAGICLGVPAGGKVLLFGAFTDDLVARGLKAGELIRSIAPVGLQARPFSHRRWWFPGTK